MISKKTNRKTNLIILFKLIEIVIKWPQLRFGQILFNFVLSSTQSETCQIHIDDPYYETSERTLSRINNNLNNYNGKNTSSS